jgi:hypothetical protein
MQTRFSWRLGGAFKQANRQTEADIQLLNHEWFEFRFERLIKADYKSAHDAANRSGRPSGLEGKE